MKISMCLVHLAQQAKSPFELLIAWEPVTKNDNEVERISYTSIPGV